MHVVYEMNHELQGFNTLLAGSVHVRQNMLENLNSIDDTVAVTQFAECKTYDHFRQVDVKRMMALAKDFPGVILVFATLRKELTANEKNLLRPLANRGRKYWKAERPYNPVLILTGTELFADFRPEYSWKDGTPAHTAMAQKMRGHMSLLELCHATQQLYLDTKPWHEWLRERWDLKRAKMAAQKAAVPSIGSPAV